MQTAAKKFLAVCGMVVMLVLVASITAVPAYAASNGIYTATATPHYRNPDTGKIEDAAGADSEVLGQSMTESATDPAALVEVDPKGNTYVTLRLHLVGSTGNIQFKVDDSPVSYEVMQEDYANDSADFRMRVSSEYSTIRVSMYVEPMGRDVIFFITLSGLQEGHGDFITSVDVVKPEKPSKPSKPAKPNKTDFPTKTDIQNQENKAEVNEETVSDSVTRNEENKVKKPQKDKETKKTEENKKDEQLPKKKDNKKMGLQEFDAAGNAVNESAVTDSISKNHMKTFAIVGGVIVVAVAAGFGIWYFGFFRKKK